LAASSSWRFRSSSSCRRFSSFNSNYKHKTKGSVPYQCITELQLFPNVLFDKWGCLIITNKVKHILLLQWMFCTCCGYVKKENKVATKNHK
jgi:hypothetical protein